MFVNRREEKDTPQPKAGKVSQTDNNPSRKTLTQKVKDAVGKPTYPDKMREQTHTGGLRG